MIWLTIIQVISASCVVLSRTLILEQQAAWLQEASECLFLLESWGYSLVLLSDPQMRLLVRHTVNGSPEREWGDNLAEDSFLGGP